MLYEVTNNAGYRAVTTRHGLYTKMTSLGNNAEVVAIMGCIEWTESYPILKRIADRAGYTITEHETDIMEL